MRSIAGVVGLLAMLCLTGCARKVVLAAAAPPPPTPTVSVPPPTHPSDPIVEAPVIASDSIAVPVEPVKKPTPPRPRTRTIAPAQTAAVSAPPITELGELTTGGESNNDALRRETDSLLKSQNRRLSGLTRAIIALHSHQVEQARLFLRQAGEAWNKQDVEGARTLATKAKVLLDEVLS